MLNDLESCTAGHQNARCHTAQPEELEDAHDLGLSCGKYRAYLELYTLDPSITHHPRPGGLDDHAGNPGPAGPAGKRFQQQWCFLFLHHNRPGSRPPPRLRPRINTLSLYSRRGKPAGGVFFVPKCKNFARKSHRKR